MNPVDSSKPLNAEVAARWAIWRGKHGFRNPPKPTHSTNIRAKALSVRDVANRFGLPPAAVQREMRALKEGRPNSKSFRPCGRPRKLTESDEKALTLYVCFMAREAMPVTKPLVRVAIDELIARRTLPDKPISDSSIDRFWREHRELHVPTVKTVELAKLSFEHQVEAIEKYYSLRKKTMALSRIHILLHRLAESSKIGVDDVIEAIEAASDEDGDLPSNSATPHSHSVFVPLLPVSALGRGTSSPLPADRRPESALS